jgi:hypothetical protein
LLTGQQRRKCTTDPTRADETNLKHSRTRREI